MPISISQLELELSTPVTLIAVSILANRLRFNKWRGLVLDRHNVQYASRIFEIDDIEDHWTYSQKFDFIHGRLLISCFKDFRAVLKRAFDALSRGGCLEIQDADSPMKCVDDS